MRWQGSQLYLALRLSPPPPSLLRQHRTAGFLGRETVRKRYFLIVLLSSSHFQTLIFRRFWFVLHVGLGGLVEFPGFWCLMERSQVDMFVSLIHIVPELWDFIIV